jgi:hypothetical protein
MTVKDQIPSFPDLIGIRAVRDEVAHGTSDYQRIQGKYYSTAEREYAEELAMTKTLDFLQQGLIRATGRMSETKKGSAARWEVQQYKHHSKIRTYIEGSFWRTAVFAKYGLNTARIEGREYVDILLVLNDCAQQLGDDVKAHGDGPKTELESNKDVPEYTTPYIELMWQAIDHFKISNDNQPIKDNLVEWFLSQEIAGQKISRATAEYLASFVRLPASRLGGNRPWKVRAEQPRPQ